eukprot:TRINITY_DN3981_c0_g3_i2.p2 TRINITY_DN3981_c0_g3~~TRINITY_DN3981_c0_g3_i2.p2  ORF type:complete len:101 (-),score=5.64 TRINITY_DN3981_c0_g3_i2:13-315(-)
MYVLVLGDLMYTFSTLLCLSTLHPVVLQPPLKQLPAYSSPPPPPMPTTVRSRSLTRETIAVMAEGVVAPRERHAEGARRRPRDVERGRGARFVEPPRTLR